MFVTIVPTELSNLMHVIYRHTNKLNLKIYVGQTVTLNENTAEESMYKRWASHCKDAKLNSKLRFHVAIRDFGEENFLHEVIEICENQEQANQLEIFWIEKLKSYVAYGGYNMILGGGVGSGSRNPMAILTEEIVAKIKAAWNEEKPYETLLLGEFYQKYAKLYGVKPDTITHIIKGRLWMGVGPIVECSSNDHTGKSPITGSKLKKKWKEDEDFRQREIKKRQGENNSSAKLSEETIRQIRLDFQQVDVTKFGAKSIFYRHVAEKYSVTPELICGIVRRTCWKHVT